MRNDRGIFSEILSLLISEFKMDISDFQKVLSKEYKVTKNTVIYWMSHSSVPQEKKLNVLINFFNRKVKSLNDNSFIQMVDNINLKYEEIGLKVKYNNPIEKSAYFSALLFDLALQIKEINTVGGIEKYKAKYEDFEEETNKTNDATTDLLNKTEFFLLENLLLSTINLSEQTTKSVNAFKYLSKKNILDFSYLLLKNTDTVCINGESIMVDYCDYIANFLSSKITAIIKSTINVSIFLVDLMEPQGLDISDWDVFKMINSNGNWNYEKNNWALKNFLEFYHIVKNQPEPIYLNDIKNFRTKIDNMDFVYEKIENQYENFFNSKIVYPIKSDYIFNIGKTEHFDGKNIKFEFLKNIFESVNSNIYGFICIDFQNNLSIEYANLFINLIKFTFTYSDSFFEKYWLYKLQWFEQKILSKMIEHGKTFTHTEEDIMLAAQYWYGIGNLATSQP